MPGFGTTTRTRSNAEKLAENLGITFRTIPITDAVRQHFKDIGHDESTHDVTYENSQAHERTQILMDLGNEIGGFVVGTGDLSELALGWATYNGDHMSMYHVNAGVPKTLVRYLVEWATDAEFSDEASATLHDIAATPITPELLPLDAEGNLEQKTEDTIGPYELHDFFLYQTVRFQFSPKKVFALAAQAFAGRVRRRDDPEMAGRLLPTLLQPAVQALGHARRAEGGVGRAIAPRRLAHAQRRQRGAVAGGGGAIKGR